MIEIVNYIKDKVSTIPEILHFDLWNNQIYNEQTEVSFNTPAVFLDFSQLTWDTSTGQQHLSNTLFTQKGDITITLWLVVNSLAPYLETFTNIIMPIRTLLLATLNLQEIPNIGSLIRLSEEYDNNHDGVCFWKITFNLRLLEDLTDDELQEVMASLDLTITAPVINPIRSNKEV